MAKLASLAEQTCAHYAEISSFGVILASRL